MQTQLFVISFLSASRLLFWLTHDPGGPVWNQTPCRKEGQLISESGACRGEVWDLRTSGTRFKCSHAPLTLYDIIWLIFKKKTNSSNPSTVHLIASLLSWHLTFRFMKAFRERFFKEKKIIQFPEISRSWNCHMVSFSFCSPVGCRCGGAGTCKSRKRAHWASAWQPHTPAPPWAHALSHAQLRPHCLRDTGLPRDCGVSACSYQILPSSQLLPRTAQTQSGFRQTQALIG